MGGRKTLVYENGFEGGLEGFVQEGGGRCFTECGRLYLDDSENKKGLTLWLDRRFEGNLGIEYDAMAVAPELHGNINLFFMARTLGGARVLDERHTGAYEEYHRTCEMYIATFVGGPGNANRHARLRKNPGFLLLSENLGFYTRLNEPYHIEASVRATEIKYSINGAVVHRVQDDNPYGYGWFGLRTWNSKIWVDNLKIHEFR